MSDVEPFATERQSDVGRSRSPEAGTQPLTVTFKSEVLPALRLAQRIRIAFPMILAAQGQNIAVCIPAHEQTQSLLNTEADRWDGGKNFTTTAADAYGRPLSSTIEKTTLHYVLEIRSAGPDGLPKNTDDIVVSRSKHHGEGSIAGEAAKAAESVAGGAASGTIKGIKKGLGLGGDKK